MLTYFHEDSTALPCLSSLVFARRGLSFKSPVHGAKAVRVQSPPCVLGSFGPQDWPYEQPRGSYIECAGGKDIISRYDFHVTASDAIHTITQRLCYLIRRKACNTFGNSPLNPPRSYISQECSILRPTKLIRQDAQISQRRIH